MSQARTLRVAHFSDLHYGPKNLAEADRCFSAAIGEAISRRAEIAVISGDATDHALDLHSPAAVRLAAQVRRLADHCPVLMLQGTFSHEPPGTLAMFRLLGGRHPIHVADRIEQVGLTAAGQWSTSQGWRFDDLPPGLVAMFSCVPTVNRAVLSNHVGAGAAAEAVGQRLAELLRRLSPSNQAARVSGVPTLVVSHGTVFGCITEHGVPMAGFDHEFTTGSLFSAGAQAVLLGHVHRHQAWQMNGREGVQCIAYPGSVGRFHHGEDGDKGFLMWEVAADGANCTLVPTPARRTIDIAFDGKPDLDALRAAVAQQSVKGAFVRVRWSVTDEARHEVDRAAIERELAAAAEVKMEGRIVPLTRTRAAGISLLPDLAGKVAAWADVNKVLPEHLLNRLEVLSSDGPECVANRILEGSAL